MASTFEASAVHAVILRQRSGYGPQVPPACCEGSYRLLAPRTARLRQRSTMRR